MLKLKEIRNIKCVMKFLHVQPFVEGKRNKVKDKKISSMFSLLQKEKNKVIDKKNLISLWSFSQRVSHPRIIKYIETYNEGSMDIPLAAKMKLLQVKQLILKASSRITTTSLSYFHLKRKQSKIGKLRKNKFIETKEEPILGWMQ